VAPEIAATYTVDLMLAPQKPKKPAPVTTIGTLAGFIGAATVIGVFQVLWIAGQLIVLGGPDNQMSSTRTATLIFFYLLIASAVSAGIVYVTAPIRRPFQNPEDPGDPLDQAEGAVWGVFVYAIYVFQSGARSGPGGDAGMGAGLAQIPIYVLLIFLLVAFNVVKVTRLVNRSRNH
jgi:hypothetical protein